MVTKLKSAMPESARQWVARALRPRVAHLPFRRLAPASRTFGWERGQPVDRYFIERFLERNRHFVRGVCLEVRDDQYTRRFGNGTVEKRDVLDIDPCNKVATVRGDLRNLHAVPDGTYDCIILTQVLQYIDNLDDAVGETYRILKPGGTALVTVPAIMRLDESNVTDYWRFTPNALRHLLLKRFPASEIDIRSWGNMLTGIAFWMGLASEELRAKQLDHVDPLYVCTVSAKATKPFVTRCIAIVAGAAAHLAALFPATECLVYA